MNRLNILFDRSVLCLALAATLSPAAASAGRPVSSASVASSETEKNSTENKQPVTKNADAAPNQAMPHMASAVLADAPTHLLIGRTAYVTSERRLSRVYVTNPTVLSAYTATPNEVLVTAKEAGVSSLMIWDESGEAHTYFYSADVDTALLENVLKSALPNESITVRAEGSRVLLSGTVGSVASYQTADKLAAQYSKDVSNAIVVNPATARQIRLHVRMVEVDRTKLEQLGFNLFSSGSNTLGNSTTSQFPSTLTTMSGTSASSGTSNNTYTAGNKTVSIS
ncbi:MAG: pilus assembly protein N-terminal domain-containing protein, partial [Terriglobus sp.]